MAAKNHAVVLPDADKQHVVNAIVGAAFGAAGQRCMALSTLVLVGQSKQWLPDIVAKARALVVGAGADAASEVGPLISSTAKARVEGLRKGAVWMAPWSTKTLIFRKGDLVVYLLDLDFPHP